MSTISIFTIVDALAKIGPVDNDGRKRQIHIDSDDPQVAWEEISRLTSNDVLAVPQGQQADYRVDIGNGNSLHIQDFSKNGYWRFHLDLKNQVDHFLKETNAKKGIVPGVILAAALGLSPWGWIATIATSMVVAAATTKLSDEVFIFGEYMPDMDAVIVIPMQVKRH